MTLKIKKAFFSDAGHINVTGKTGAYRTHVPVFKMFCETLKLTGTPKTPPQNSNLSVAPKERPSATWASGAPS